MKSSRRWLMVLLVMAVVVGWWLSTLLADEPQSSSPPPAPAVSTSPPEVPEGPRTDAGSDAAGVAAAPTPRPNEPDVVARPPAPGARPDFQDPFCGPSGGEESVRVVHTLYRLARDEVLRREQRPEEEPAAETHALVQALTKPSAESLSLAQALPPSRWSAVAAALSARELGQKELELKMVRAAAAAGLAHDPAVGLELGLLTRDGPDVDEAIAGLGDFLAVEAVPMLARLKARLEVQRDIQRSYERREFGGLTLRWPKESLTSAQANSVLYAVDAALNDAALWVGAPRRPALTIVVYPSRSELMAVSCVPVWTGALFDGVLRLVASSDEWGVEPQSLRHETLHAELSPYAPSAPKWFHEGVAQAFAQEQGRHQREWRLMLKNHAWVPFSSLNGTFQVLGSSDAALAYAQSLAMVEFARASCGTNAVADLAAAFRAGPVTTAAALQSVCRREVTGEVLLDFMSSRLERRDDRQR